jgi:hypothetical protein
MKRFIIAGIIASLFGAVAVPAQADAAPYLSMSKAKRQARKDARAIGGSDFDLDCWRRSQSRVRCLVTFYSDDATCEATYQWYKHRYAGVLFERTIRQPYCY